MLLWAHYNGRCTQIGSLLSSLSETFSTGSAEGKRLDSTLLKVQVIRQHEGLRLCYSPGSLLVSGVLWIGSAEVSCYEAAYSGVSYWSKHVSLTHVWWMSLIVLPLVGIAFQFCFFISILPITVSVVSGSLFWGFFLFFRHCHLHCHCNVCDIKWTKSKLQQLCSTCLLRDM